MTLGNAIKLIRTAKGKKQLTVAEQLGVSSNYLSLVERDKREPSIGFLRKLAKSFGVPVGLFFLWQDASDSSLKSGNMNELRSLLTHIQAMYLEGQNEDTKDATAQSAL